MAKNGMANMLFGHFLLKAKINLSHTLVYLEYAVKNFKNMLLKISYKTYKFG